MTDPVAQAALDRALDEKEDLLLVYQPIHDTRTRRIVSAEALLRQRRQTGEIREASIITAAAERGPELFVLDSILIQTAFADAARWQKHTDIRLNLNLSPREFQEGDLVSRLANLIERCRIDPRKINVEITETTYIDRPKQTMEIIEELKKQGISLWLDDFGTGHSSLTSLQRFPLDGLKIAGSFISGIPDDHRCVAITRSLIELGHELSMEVVAEEIETDEQLQFLAGYECDYIQGFLLSCPMPIAEFTRVILTPTPPHS